MKTVKQQQFCNRHIKIYCFPDAIIADAGRFTIKYY